MNESSDIREQQFNQKVNFNNMRGSDEYFAPEGNNLEYGLASDAEMENDWISKADDKMGAQDDDEESWGDDWYSQLLYSLTF